MCCNAIYQYLCSSWQAASPLLCEARFVGRDQEESQELALMKLWSDGAKPHEIVLFVVFIEDGGIEIFSKVHWENVERMLSECQSVFVNIMCDFCIKSGLM